jgi:hypothetical protein
VCVQVEFLNGFSPSEGPLEGRALEELRSILDPLIGHLGNDDDNKHQRARGKGKRGEEVSLAVRAYASPEDGRKLWSIWKTRLRL